MGRNFTADQAAPGVSWVSVTPHDSNNLPAGCRGLYVAVAGHLVLVGYDDVAVTFSNVPVGVLPCGPKRVNATGTTATGIVAIY